MLNTTYKSKYGNFAPYSYLLKLAANGADKTTTVLTNPTRPAVDLADIDVLSTDIEAKPGSKMWNLAKRLGLLDRAPNPTRLIEMVEKHDAEQELRAKAPPEESNLSPIDRLRVRLKNNNTKTTMDDPTTAITQEQLAMPEATPSSALANAISNTTVVTPEITPPASTLSAAISSTPVVTSEITTPSSALAAAISSTPEVAPETTSPPTLAPATTKLPENIIARIESAPQQSFFSANKNKIGLGLLGAAIAAGGYGLYKRRQQQQQQERLRQQQIAAIMAEEARRRELIRNVGIGTGAALGGYGLYNALR